MSDTSEHLIEDAIRGNRDALASLLEASGPRLRQLLVNQIGPEFRSLLDIDDVLQVTFLEAFLRIGRLEDRGNEAFLSWLTTIARNNLRDAIRELQRKKRKPPGQKIEVPRRSSSIGLLDQIGWTSTTPSRKVSDREIEVQVDLALSRLPEDYERVLRLYELEGYDVDAVARLMGRSEGAIFMLRARALERLRDLLADAENLPKFE
ncbi:MAG: RNA polymerase sigma factor [Phycisphaerae bacterium]